MNMRCANWPEALAAYIDRKRNQPFAWGVNDCCLFGSDWVHLCTGLDPAEGLRGTYDNALSASRILKTHGGVSATIRAHFNALGFEPIDREKAARGDIVVSNLGGGETMGIVLGSSCAFVGENGLEFTITRRDESARFWKI